MNTFTSRGINRIRKSEVKLRYNLEQINSTQPEFEIKNLKSINLIQTLEVKAKTKHKSDQLDFMKLQISRHELIDVRKQQREVYSPRNEAYLLRKVRHD